MTETMRSGRSEGVDAESMRCHLRLFVAGDEPNSALAKAALREVCATHLKGACKVETVDVLEDFRRALEDNILVTPALVIEQPSSRTVIFGNLSDKQKVLAALRLTEKE